MNIESFFNPEFSSLPNIILFFFKAFAVLLSFIYLIYSLVFLRQTVTLSKTYETNKGRLFFYISLLQVIFAIILVILSLVVI